MPGSPVRRARRAALAAGGDPVAAGEEARRQSSKRKATKLNQEKVAELAAALTKAQMPVPVDQVGHREPTDRERSFVQFKALGMSDVQAATHAGYAFPQVDGPKIAKQPNVATAIEKQRTQYEEAGRMTKQQVLDGFKEAIDMGRLLADPISMISGWREIAKLCGYYEPQKHEIAVSVQGNLVVQKIQQLSDEELLRLAEGNVIEGEVIKTPTEGGPEA